VTASGIPPPSTSASIALVPDALGAAAPVFSDELRLMFEQATRATALSAATERNR
jgi:hypothetical protein